MIESEVRFRTLFEAAPIGIQLHDPSGRVLHVNVVLQKLLGYSVRALREMQVSDLIHPNDQGIVRKLLRGLQEERNAKREAQLRYIRKDGRVIWAQVSVSATRDHKNVAQYVIWAVQDVTDLKENETFRAGLARLSQQLSIATTAHKAAKCIVEAALEMVGWDSCYLHLYVAHKRINPVLTMDLIDGERVNISPMSFDLEPSPLMRRVTERGALLVNRNAGKVPRIRFSPFGNAKRLSASMMYVPVRVGSKIIGVLSIQSYTPSAYNRKSLQTLQTLADQCAGALARISVAENLHRIEAANGALVEAIPDYIFRLNRDADIWSVKLPQDREQSLATRLQRKRIHKLISENLAVLGKAALQRALDTGELQTVEFQIQLGGKGMKFEARFVKKNLNHALAIVRDVTERSRLEREVLEIVARERREMGHDLHDGLGQLLAGIAIKAKILEERLMEDRQRHAGAARELVNLTNKSVVQARNLARGCDPIEVEANGLVPALQRLAANIEELFTVSCRLTSLCRSSALKPFVAAQLYRIAQEALTNAIKHGKARKVRLILEPARAFIVLRVVDNGNGLISRSPAGIGLKVMHYRASAIGALLEIKSRQGFGTEIRCTVPLA